MEQIQERANALAPELLRLRRTLHQCPELGFELPQTRAVVTEELERIGCRDVRTYGGGLTAWLGKPGRTLLLRADMDALPMEEESGEPFAATNGAAHACGHDMHTAMLLGAARLLKGREAELNGRVVLMFQAAEETASGAKAMIDGGILEGVDGAFAMHVATQKPVGELNFTHGPKTASFDRFAIHIEGQGGHGAFPHKTADPVNAAVHLYLALQELVSHECPPDETAVLTIGAFQAGAAGNVIPASARLEGTARAARRETRELLLRRLEELAQGICAAFRTWARVEYLSQVPPLYNDPALAGRMAKAARSVLGAGRVNEDAQRLTASEDFALASERVPTVYATIGTGLAADGYRYGNHHPAVRYDEDILPLGAAVFAACAVDFLKTEPGSGQSKAQPNAR